MSEVLSSDGRWLVTAPSNYKGKTYIGGRYVFHYRLLMERKLGRLLKPNEQVHHKNGNKLDDRIENLEVIDILDHRILHANLSKGKPNVYCKNCNKHYHVRLAKLKNAKARFCKRSCYVEYVQLNNWGK